MDTKIVKIGNIFIGGKNKIRIQSMLSISSDNVSGNIEQARILQNAGCEILRVSIPDKDALSLIDAIKQNTSMPLVADIHFDYKLALESISAGIDKIRINPGNIGDEDRIKQVADACRLNNIPIRIGVNGGSLEKHLLAKYQHPTAEALVESALYNARLLEKYDFENIVISMKSSDVKTTIEAYRMLSQQVSYPLHLGVTETGTERLGIVKSAIGIGSLLADGIGDTMRVSLTADPVREIETAKAILSSLNLDDNAPRLIACPTCGRTKIDIIKYANAVDEKLKSVKKPIKVAVMGCVVNGPGEAREADVGIAGGDHCAILFKKGEVVRKLEESEILTELFKEIDVLSE